nr:MAG TPA: hypothetical protein [Caudoviricetes sp.]
MISLDEDIFLSPSGLFSFYIKIIKFFKKRLT